MGIFYVPRKLWPGAPQVNPDQQHSPVTDFLYYRGQRFFLQNSKKGNSVSFISPFAMFKKGEAEGQWEDLSKETFHMLFLAILKKLLLFPR